MNTSHLTKYSTLTGLLLVLSIGSTALGSTTEIIGQVIDDDGIGIPNVQISSSENNLYFTSDKDGQFRIPVTPGKAYELTFQHIGFINDTLSLAHNRSGGKSVLIVLSPINLSFSPVTVIGNKMLHSEERFEPSMRLVYSDALKQTSGFLGADLFRVLGRSASSSSTSEFSNQLYIRGGTPDQNLTLLNGVPIYQPYHLLGMASSVSEETVDFLKFYTGNFSVAYGDHLSSVVDIVTKSGGPELEIATDINLLSATVTASGPATSSIRWRITGRRSYYDLLRSFSEQDFDYNFQDLEGRVSFMPNESSLLTLNTFFSSDQYESQYSEQLINKVYRYDSNPHVALADSNKYYKNLESTVNWGNHVLGLNYLRRLGKNKTINIVAYYSDLIQGLSYLKAYLPHIQASASTLAEVLYENERRLLEPEGTSVSGGLHDVGVNTRLNIKRDRYTISMGTGITKQTLSYDWQFRRFDVISPYINYLMDFPPDSLNKDFVLVQGNGFAELGYQFGSRLFTRTGLRASYNGFNGSTALEPRVNLRYALNSKMSLKLAWGLFSQSLGTSTEYGFYSLASAYFPINEGFSTAIHTLMGLDYSSDRFSVEVNLYDKKYSNVLFRDVSKSFVYGTGHSIGAELSSDILIGQNMISQLAYSYADNQKTIGDVTFYPNYDIRHNLKMSSLYNMNEKHSFSLSWTLNTGRPANLYLSRAETAIPSGSSIQDSWVETLPLMMITPMNFLRYPTFHRMDMRYSRHFKYKSGSGEIYLNIINLYNRQNVLYYDRIEYNDKEVPYLLDGETYYRKTREYVANPKNGFPLLPIVGVDYAF